MLGGVDYILEAVALSALSSPTSDIQDTLKITFMVAFFHFGALGLS